jgi:hypothetical protein
LFPFSPPLTTAAFVPRAACPTRLLAIQTASTSFQPHSH